MNLGDIKSTLVPGKLAIAAGQQTAATPFDCQNQPPLLFVTPSNWTACTLTFSVLPFTLDGVTYVDGTPVNNQLAPVYDQTGTATLYSIQTGSGYGFYSLSPALFNSVRYMNVQCSVAQAENVNLYFGLTALWQGIHA